MCLDPRAVRRRLSVLVNRLRSLALLTSLSTRCLSISTRTRLSVVYDLYMVLLPPMKGQNFDKQPWLAKSQPR